MFIKCKQCKNVLSIGDFREIPNSHSYEDTCKYCSKTNEKIDSGYLKYCRSCEKFKININNDGFCIDCDYEHKVFKRNDLNNSIQNKWVCFNCGDFHDPQDIKGNICKHCIGIKQRAKKFNISEKQVRILLASTNCSICDYEFQNNKEKHIDHCHKTDKVREVLCIRCNTALGNIKDDIKILGNMFRYLSKHST